MDENFNILQLLNKENNEIEKKQAFSVIRYNEDKKKTDTVLDSDKVDFYDFVNKAFKKPTIVFPAKFFIEDAVYLNFLVLKEPLV